MAIYSSHTYYDNRRWWQRLLRRKPPIYFSYGGEDISSHVRSVTVNFADDLSTRAKCERCGNQKALLTPSGDVLCNDCERDTA